VNTFTLRRVVLLLSFPVLLASPLSGAARELGKDEESVWGEYLVFETCSRRLPGYASKHRKVIQAWRARNASLLAEFKKNPERLKQLRALDGFHPLLCTDDVVLALEERWSGPDPRFSTPESTWQSWVKALRSGDRRAALACLSPEARRAFGHVLMSLPAKSLKAQADRVARVSFSAEPYGEFREAFIMSADGAASVVMFQKINGNWKITSL